MDLAGRARRPQVVAGEHVDLASGVLAEAQHVVVEPPVGRARHAQLLDAPQAALARRRREQRAVGGEEAAAEVAEDVAPAQLRQVAAAVDVPADDDDAEPVDVGVGGVGVLDHRLEQRRPGVGVRRADHGGAARRRGRVVLGVEAVRALLHVPAIVAAPSDERDLLPQPLPGVADQQRPAAPHVEREAVGVAEAIREDLVAAVGAAGAGGERVVGRDGVGRGAVDVEAQQVAEQVVLHVLPVAAAVVRVPILDVAQPDVVGAAAVADRDVEVAVVGTEGESAGVVVELRLVDLQQDDLRGRVGEVRVARDAQLGDRARAVEARRRAGAQGRAVVDEEAAVRRVIGVEGEAEQAALVEARLQGDELGAQVEKRRRQARAVGVEDPHQTHLVDDEEAPRAVRRRHQVHRRGEGVGDELHADGHRVAHRGLRERGGGERGR